MTSDLIRDVLSYPDSDQLPDLAAVEARARRIRRRRTATLVAAGAVGAAGLGVGATVMASGSGPAATAVLPAAGSTARPTATPTVTPTVTPTATAGALTASEGEKVDMGQAWKVWLQDDAVCRSSPADTGTGRYQPFGCRSISDGNIGGMNAQVSGTAEGTLVSAVIPYDAASVVVSVGTHATDARLLRFRGVHGWTFYWAWLPEEATSPTVAAYDEDGVLIGLLDSQHPRS